MLLLEQGKVLVVSDETVADLYGDAALASLSAAGLEAAVTMVGTSNQSVCIQPRNPNSCDTWPKPVRGRPIFRR